MTLGPAPILALVVAVFHVSLYVLIRGSAGQRLPVLVVAAFLGAWSGDALAGRLGLDPVRIGDFHLVGASLLAWVGIAAVALVALLGRDGSGDAAGHGHGHGPGDAPADAPGHRPRTPRETEP